VGSERFNQALLSLDMPSWAYTSNGVQLLIDGDMEAAGVAAWTARNGVTLTKETTTPYGGAQCLRTASGAAWGLACQAVVTIGKTYRVTGRCRGDGVNVAPQLYFSDAWTAIGTTSNSWQQFDFTGALTTNALGFGIGFGKLGIAGYAEYDDLRLEWLPASTRNLGSLGGYAQLGDGYTAATFPTQVFPHGMSFDGATDYLNFLRPSELSFATLAGNELPFSLECLVRVDSYASMRSLFSKGTFGASLEYASLLSAGNWLLYLIDSSQVAWIAAASLLPFNVSPFGTVHHLISTYDGTRNSAGIRMYADGRQATTTLAPVGGYTRMANLGADATYSRTNGTGAVPLLGSTYNAAIYPFALQPGEVASLCRQRFALLNRGAG
jgi:hypothetical protein